jgi:hypothetical protein
LGLFILDPLLQNLPQNGIPVPLTQDIPLVNALSLTSARKRPARIPGLVSTNAAFLVPDNIRKKFAEGWVSHVPLTFLTDKGCVFKDKAVTSLTQEVLTMNTVTGHIEATSQPLTDEGELDLTFDEWHQAWRRLLDLIRTFLPHEFLMWEVHYSFILNKENRAELWPVYLAYDVEIRKKAVQQPIDPSQFAIGVWNDLEARYTAKKVLSIIQADLKNQSIRLPSDKHKPRNSTQNPSFRDQRNPSDPSKTGRCIFCGDRSKSHLSRNCNASCNTSGSPCHLHRVEAANGHGHTRQSKSGKRYCFAWNGTSGCDEGTSCQRGAHFCTLCGTTSHAAQQCDAVA